MSWTTITPSAAAQATFNPIRGVVDKISPDPKHPKSFLKLSIGDPTIDKNLLPPPCAIEAIQHAVASHQFDGYGPAIGYPESRAAVAGFWNENFVNPNTAHSGPEGGKKFVADDVILTSGASQALEIAISALCNPGDVLLTPAPGFSLYSVICSNKGVENVLYHCVAEKQWEIDLVALEKSILEIKESKRRLRAVLVNNPGNPTGSNFTPDHVKAVCALCAKHHLPIIADEIYAGMAFNGAVFTSVANFAEVPALIVGGIAKSFVVPGWRLGWIIKHDLISDAAQNEKPLDRIWNGCWALATLIIGPNTIIQAALPKMLANAETKEYRNQLTKTIGDQSALCYDLLKNASGLRPIRADGAMYMLIGIDCKNFDASWGIADDVQFATELMKEENVQVLPGSIFHIPGFFRIVVTKPPSQLKEAIERIVAFDAKLKLPKQ
jgi:tyrosine aminotransferase